MYNSQFPRRVIAALLSLLILTAAFPLPVRAEGPAKMIEYLDTVRWDYEQMEKQFWQEDGYYITCRKYPNPELSAYPMGNDPDAMWLVSDGGRPSAFSTNGLFHFKQSGKDGFIDREGHVVIPPLSDWTLLSTHFNDGLITVGRKEKNRVVEYGCMDTSGNIVFTSESMIGVFHDGRAVCGGNIIDREGHVVKELGGTILKNVDARTSTDGVYFSDGLLGVQFDEKHFGFLDRDGNTVKTYDYDDSDSRDWILATVSSDAYWKGYPEDSAGTYWKVHYSEGFLLTPVLEIYMNPAPPQPKLLDLSALIDMDGNIVNTIHEVFPDDLYYGDGFFNRNDYPASLTRNGLLLFERGVYDVQTGEFVLKFDAQALSYGPYLLDDFSDGLATCNDGNIIDLSGKAVISYGEPWKGLYGMHDAVMDATVFPFHEGVALMDIYCGSYYYDEPHTLYLLEKHEGTYQPPELTAFDTPCLTSSAGSIARSTENVGGLPRTVFTFPAGTTFALATDLPWRVTGDDTHLMDLTTGYFTPKNGEIYCITVMEKDGTFVDRYVRTEDTDSAQTATSFPDGYFAPPVSEPAFVGQFTDVPSGAYYANAVKWAVENGITKGVSATEFNPGGSCTRGQAATFLWRASGSPKPKSASSPFRDIGSYHPFYQSILWAYENGITIGVTEDIFDSPGPCAHTHVLTFLWRLKGKPEAVPGTAANGLTGDFARAVSWAESRGAFAERNVPDLHSVCSRADMVTYLYRLLP